MQTFFCANQRVLRENNPLTKQPRIHPRPNQTRNQSDEQSPQRLHEVVLFLMVGCVHVLGAGLAHGLQVGEEHPIEEEFVNWVELRRVCRLFDQISQNVTGDFPCDGACGCGGGVLDNLLSSGF